MSHAKTFEAHLVSDLELSAEPPTPQFTYPAGQPATIVSLAEELRGGPTLLHASWAFYLYNTANSILDENQPWADFFLYFDNLLIDKLGAEFIDYSLGTATGDYSANHPISAVGRAGTLSRVVNVSPGPHQIDLRAGVSGAGPHALAQFKLSTWPHHATLIVQEVAQ